MAVAPRTSLYGPVLRLQKHMQHSRGVDDLATVIQTPVPDDDDDLVREAVASACLADINRLVSQQHTSLRLQNDSAEATSAQERVHMSEEECEDD